MLVWIKETTVPVLAEKILDLNLFPLVSTLAQKPLRGREWAAISIPAFKIFTQKKNNHRKNMGALKLT